MNQPLPRWFRKTIGDGLEKILGLRLQGTPPKETFKITLGAWAEAVWCNRRWREEDMPALTQAFSTALGQIEHWPAPATVLKHIPTEPPAAHRLLLPEPPATDAQRQQGRDAIALAKRVVAAAVVLPKKKQGRGRQEQEQEQERRLLQDAKRRFAHLDGVDHVTA